jgi:hypothetical protein
MASIHRALVMPAGPEENLPDPRLMNPNGQYDVATTFTASWMRSTDKHRRN